MKKLMLVASMLFMMALPRSASTGTAYIPFFNAWKDSANTLMTELNIANISNVTQQVVITIYYADGTPFANQTATYYGLENGATGTAVTTNAQGQISINLPGNNLLQLDYPSLSSGAMGYGQITGTVLSGNGSGFLVASGIILWRNSSNLNYPIVINGGKPF